MSGRSVCIVEVGISSRAHFIYLFIYIPFNFINWNSNEVCGECLCVWCVDV